MFSTYNNTILSANRNNLFSSFSYFDAFYLFFLPNFSVDNFNYYGE